MDRLNGVLDEMKIMHDWRERKDGSWYGIVEFWTEEAGQDIPTEIEFNGSAKDFVEKFYKAAENYDVDSEVEIYVPMRGERGVPYHVMDIVRDCQEAKDKLMGIAIKLKDTYFEEKWDELADVPFEESSEGKMYLACDWLEFKAGEDKEEIWRWFDRNHSKGIHWLLYEREGIAC